MAAPLPAYLIKGDDAALRGEAVRTLVAELVGDGDHSLIVEEHGPPGDDADTSAIADAAQTPPFLTERRVVVVRDVNSYSSDALTPLVQYLADPLPTTSLVLVTAGGRIAPKLADAVKKIGHVIETSVPAQKRGRTGWLTDRLKDAPIKLEPAAVALVDEHLGDDLGRLPNILDTLQAAYGSGARITVDDIRPFLGEAGSVPPWELTDAIDAGDTARAVEALTRIMEGGDRHPLQIMATLHGHYGRMLRLDGAGAMDEAQAAEVLGMKGSTFPAKKALTQVRTLGHAGVAEAFRLLSEADLDLRGIRKDWPESLVMEVLVARLSRLGGRSRTAGARR